jgi:sulfur-carrier protein adenylyltransferase/sulfurtransferase
MDRGVDAGLARLGGSPDPSVPIAAAALECGPRVSRSGEAGGAPGAGETAGGQAAGPRVRIPGPLQAYCDGEAEVAVRGTTVGEALQAVVARYPRLRGQIFDEPGELRRFVNVYVNKEDIRERQGLETPVTPADNVTVLPSIAGGSPEAAAFGAPAGGGAQARSAAPLSTAELARYARHLVLPEFGLEGQERLKAARVLLVGAGGLGSPAALYLAAAGIGMLGLVDFDVVDESNLHRQVLFGQSQLGREKVDSAVDRLTDLNPYVQVERHPVRLSSDNALDIVRGYDLVVDGSDNFPTRYLVNDACVLSGIPYVYGAIFRFEGQVSIFGASSGPCYRCLFREPPPPGAVPSCAEGGVIGVLPGIIGTMQALEAIKWVAGVGDPLVGRLVLFDALRLQWRELRLRRDRECPACGDNPSITTLMDYEEFCGLKSDQRGAGFEEVPEMTVTELKARLDRGESMVLVDVREPYEWQIANLGPQGAQLIPLSELSYRADELDPAQEIVLYCRSGNRSGRAARQLRAQGFSRVWNLQGGILAWSDQIDPSIRKY